MILFAFATFCFSCLWIPVWTGTHMLGLISSAGFHCLLLFVCCSLCPICIRWQGIIIQMNYTVSVLFIMSESVFCREGQRYRGDIVIGLFRWAYKGPFTPAPTLHFTAVFCCAFICLNGPSQLCVRHIVICAALDTAVNCGAMWCTNMLDCWMQDCLLCKLHKDSLNLKTVLS